MSRSKRYKELALKVDKTKSYAIEEAVRLIQATAKVKFDSSVEVHVRLEIDPKKGDQSVRGNIVLPHGTGKSDRVVVLSEEEKIVKDGGGVGVDCPGGG